MKKMGLILLASVFLAWNGAFALADSGEKVIYFGIYEMENGGTLKSADGSLPRPGERVDLRLDLGGFSRFLCGTNTYCVGMHPELYVRFKSSESFKQISGLPVGGVNGRGPADLLGNHDVTLVIPSDAEKIEAYMKWKLYSYSTSNCHLAYDMTECDISMSGESFSEPYLSNYGRNFSIEVAR